MILSDWLKQEGISPTDFARRLNKPQATVARYVTGKRIPEPPIMRDIFDLTGGQVTPNDFYGCAASPEAESAV